MHSPSWCSLDVSQFRICRAPLHWKHLYKPLYPLQHIVSLPVSRAVRLHFVVVIILCSEPIQSAILWVWRGLSSHWRRTANRTFGSILAMDQTVWAPSLRTPSESTMERNSHSYIILSYKRSIVVQIYVSPQYTTFIACSVAAIKEILFY